MSRRELVVWICFTIEVSTFRSEFLKCYTTGYKTSSVLSVIAALRRDKTLLV